MIDMQFPTVEPIDKITHTAVTKHVLDRRINGITCVGIRGDGDQFAAYS